MATKTMDQYSEEGERAALAASRSNMVNMRKSEWNSARNTLAQAPSREKAEKDYYYAADKHKVYNDILEKDRAEAKKITDEWDDFFSKVDFIDNIFTIFKTQRHYVDNLDDVEYNYKSKYNELKQKVNDTGQKKKIADRLSEYTNERNEYVVYAKDTLKYICYLFVLAIIPIFIWKNNTLLIKK